MGKIKEYKERLRAHSKFNTVLNWGKLISITGLSQILIQAIGFISGILIIRLMPVEEYALYTLANTMLGMMTVLSDGGITTGVMSEGGKVWKDNDKLGLVLSTGLKLRKKFAIISLAITLPVLVYLLLKNNASWLTTIMIVLSIIPAFYASLSDSLLSVVPRLHQAILPFQKNQVSVGVFRLILTALTIVIFPMSYIAVLASGLPRVWGNFQLRKIVYGLTKKKDEVDTYVKKRILKVVYLVMPGSIYYAFSGQITVWLISIFGDTENIAQIGALSRLMMFISVINSLLTQLVMPRFARVENDEGRVVKLFTIFVIVIFVFVFMIIGVAYLFSTEMLYIIGRNYSGLTFELRLMVISSCMAFLSQSSYGMLSSRGIIMNPYLFYSIISVTQVICLLTLDLSQVSGVIYFSIYPAIVGFLCRVIHFYYFELKNK